MPINTCSRYFSTHVGSPISVFMGMKRSDPVRQQLEKALGALPDKHEREAAQHCIKLTANRK